MNSQHEHLMTMLWRTTLLRSTFSFARLPSSNFWRHMIQ